MSITPKALLTGERSEWFETIMRKYDGNVWIYRRMSAIESEDFAGRVAW